ncbi:MAG: T9SS type A sorting domain-containing protein [Flavobacteriales bacterium]
MKIVFNIFIILFLSGSLSASRVSVPKNDPPVDKRSDIVQVYPNPAKDFFYVSTKNNVQVKRIIVFNIVGNKILDYSPKHIHSQKEQINISRLASGKYFVKVLLNNNTQEIIHLIKL